MRTAACTLRSGGVTSPLLAGRTPRSHRTPAGPLRRLRVADSAAAHEVSADAKPESRDTPPGPAPLQRCARRVGTRCTTLMARAGQGPQTVQPCAASSTRRPPSAFHRHTRAIASSAHPILSHTKQDRDHPRAWGDPHQTPLPHIQPADDAPPAAGASFLAHQPPEASRRSSSPPGPLPSGFSSLSDSDLELGSDAFSDGTLETPGQQQHWRQAQHEVRAALAPRLLRCAAGAAPQPPAGSSCGPTEPSVPPRLLLLSPMPAEGGAPAPSRHRSRGV